MRGTRDAVACALAVALAIATRSAAAAPARGPEPEPAPAPEPQPEPDAPIATDEPSTPAPDDASASEGEAEPGEPPAEPAETTDAGATPPPKDFVWGEGSEAAPPPTTGAPGGYLGPTETKELAPPDGERKLLAGYILVPLGTLAMVSGAVMTWFTHPDHCQERLGKSGEGLDRGECKGLWILNIIRTTYGSLMIVSGATLLGIGLVQRKRHREWTRKHGAYVQPWFHRGGGGLSFGSRF